MTVLFLRIFVILMLTYDVLDCEIRSNEISPAPVQVTDTSPFAVMFCVTPPTVKRQVELDAPADLAYSDIVTVTTSPAANVTAPAGLIAVITRPV